MTVLLPKIQARNCCTDEDIGTNKHEPVRVSAMLDVRNAALPMHISVGITVISGGVGVKDE